MSRSHIIKDVANGSVPIEVGLKRLLVLLSSLENKKLSLWVQNELTGYDAYNHLPYYRKVKGLMVGTYVVRRGFRQLKYKDHPIPIGNLDPAIREAAETFNIVQSVSALAATIKYKKTLKIYLPIEQMHNLYCSQKISILSAYKIVDYTQLQGILATTEQRLLEVLLLLEKEFGLLDNLDVDLNTKSKSDIKNIERNIYLVLYQNNAITIGDKNKFESSEVHTKSTL